MSTSSPKWSRKSARRASGVLSAALGAFAAALIVACGSAANGDAGIGLSPPQGPINWGAVQTLAINPAGVTPPTAVFGADGAVSVLWSQIGMPVAGVPSPVPLVGVRENTTGTTTFTAAEAIETGTPGTTDQIHELDARRSMASVSAVWRRRIGTGGDRLISSLRHPAGWTQESIRNASTAASAAELTFATNDAGVRVAVWTELVLPANVRLVQLSVRQAGAGWSTPVVVQTNQAVNGASPAVAVDSTGVAMIVWRQGDAPGLIRARTFDTTSGTFRDEFAVDSTQIVNDGRDPRVAPLGGGRFVATWEQAGGGGAYDLRANTWTGAAWLITPRTIELGSGTVAQSVLVPGPLASAFAVWTQNNTVFFVRYTDATGNWSDARQVSGTVVSHTPRVAVDGNGNAIFVWLQTPSGSMPDDLFYATFTASTSTISGAFQLDTETTGAADSPSLSVAANGAAVVAWLQNVAGQTNPNVAARVFRP
jgi:hypothetical protein